MSFYPDPVAIIFKKPFTQKIGKIELDLTKSRTVSEKVTLTHNPVELGFNTDHARDEPTEIRIKGLMSKFSLKNSAYEQISTLKDKSIPNRLKDAHDELLKIIKAKEPMDIVTKYRTHKNMIMTVFELLENPEDGEALIFSSIFKQVKIVSSKLVKIPNSAIKIDSAKNQSSFGRQQGAEEDFVPITGDMSLREFFGSIF